MNLTLVCMHSVVPINWITIRNRLLGNFATISIGKFQGYNIGLLKSNDLITLYMKLSQISVSNLLILTEPYHFVNLIVYL